MVLAGWTRLTGSSSRIVGLDVARGLAVIGMIAAHVLILDEFDWATPDTWGAVVNGRSSVLFATLAGVSIAIISGRSEPFTGVELVQARVRILVRAATLFAIGGILVATNVLIYVILEFYAVYFVLALPFLRWRPRSLLVLAGGLAIVAPIVHSVGTAAFASSGLSYSVIVDLILTGEYPALIWMVFVLTGLAIGRLDLASTRVHVRLAVLGAVVSVAGYGAGAVAISTGGTSDLLTIQPHTGSPFEVVGAVGFAVAVIGVCLLISRALRFVVFPLAAVGSMALTAYTAQILAIVVFWHGGNDYWIFGADNAPIFWALAIGVVVGCTAWAMFLGRGPLERLLGWASWRAARTTPTPAPKLDPTP
jgi:uncharacterized membrane protein YeiB